MTLRHVALIAVALFLVALTASSPHDAAFWVVLGCAVFILLPYLGAIVWFQRQIRRELRDRGE